MDNSMKIWWNKWKDVIIIAIIAFVLGLLYMFLFRNLDLSASGIVLGFFGILATFVVIGNYAQVITIKSEVKEEIADIKDESKINSLAYKINGLYGAGGRPKYEEDIDQKVARSIDKLRKEYNADLITIFDFMLKNQHQDFLSKILQGKEVRCMVVTAEDNNPHQARAKIEGEQIIFRNTHREIVEHIVFVSNKPYDSKAFDRIVQWWKRNMVEIPPQATQNLIFGDRGR